MSFLGNFFTLFARFWANENLPEKSSCVTFKGELRSKKKFLFFIKNFKGITKKKYCH